MREQSKSTSIIFSNQIIQIIGLFVAGVLFNLIFALFQKTPGYMDAEYYYSGGYQLFHGYGFNENILWNYLDNPTGIPHPSHLYWMPLSSIIAAGGMYITGASDYFSSKILFIFISGFIPVFGYILAYSYRRNLRDAFVAGSISLLSGYYSIYSSNTETFTLYMLLGALYIITAFIDTDIYLNISSDHLLRYIILGIISGFMHITRADGALWFVSGIGLICWKMFTNKFFQFKKLLAIIIGYCFITFPWYYRNFTLFGSLFSPSGFRALWLTNYNQIFSFPAEILTFQNWMSSGWLHHLQDRLTALSMNLKNIVAVEGQVYLLPLIVIGMISYWKSEKVKFGFLIWVATFFIMTFIFPYAGSRGGLLHSGAALQIFFWSLVPIGLDKFIQWGGKVRKWKYERAYNLFFGLLLIMGTLFTFYIFKIMVIGDIEGIILWDQSERTYQKVEQIISMKGANQTDIVVVNNPAGYFAINKRPSIVIPDGDVNTLLLVANKMNAKYLVLEKNHVDGLSNLYDYPVSSKQLSYVGTFDEVEIFIILENK